MWPRPAGNSTHHLPAILPVAKIRGTMPKHNKLAHQSYTPDPPRSPFEIVPLDNLQGRRCSPTTEPERFGSGTGEVGRIVREAGVTKLYLVHGTFVGSDPSGLFSSLTRFAGERLARIGFASDAVRTLVEVSRFFVDKGLHDRGRYTREYQRILQQAINPIPSERPVNVELFDWSSENNHIGRSESVLQLLDKLFPEGNTPQGRVLLWGHSHAGNVFALLTNLLAAEKDVEMIGKVGAFFDAVQRGHGHGIIPRVSITEWRARLTERTCSLGRHLDIVTFGTPIRYGWETSGCAKLLHVVHHRPVAGDPAPYLAPSFPPSPNKVLKAPDGDYVQQFAIAGTDLPSLGGSARNEANSRLAELLEGHALAVNKPQLSVQAKNSRGGNLLRGKILRGAELDQKLARVSGLIEAWKQRRRVPDDGQTLLVDYGVPDGNPLQHVFGHAVYMQLDWLLFHAQEVARRLNG